MRSMSSGITRRVRRGCATAAGSAVSAGTRCDAPLRNALQTSSALVLVSLHLLL